MRQTPSGYGREGTLGCEKIAYTLRTPSCPATATRRSSLIRRPLHTQRPKQPSHHCSSRSRDRSRSKHMRRTAEDGCQYLSMRQSSMLLTQHPILHSPSYTLLTSILLLLFLRRFTLLQVCTRTSTVVHIEEPYCIGWVKSLHLNVKERQR